MKRRSTAAAVNIVTMQLRTALIESAGGSVSCGVEPDGFNQKRIFFHSTSHILADKTAPLTYTSS